VCGCVGDKPACLQPLCTPAHKPCWAAGSTRGSPPTPSQPCFGCNPSGHASKPTANPPRPTSKHSFLHTVDRNSLHGGRPNYIFNQLAVPLAVLEANAGLAGLNFLIKLADSAVAVYGKHNIVLCTNSPLPKPTLASRNWVVLGVWPLVGWGAGSTRAAEIGTGATRGSLLGGGQGSGRREADCMQAADRPGQGCARARAAAASHAATV
jgi:hypothetical protein